MKKRARKSKEPRLFIDPIVDTPKRPPKIWQTSDLHEKSSACTCTNYTICQDSRRLEMCLKISWEPWHFDEFCHFFEQGDIVWHHSIQFLFERHVHWDGTLRRPQFGFILHGLYGHRQSVAASWADAIAESLADERKRVDIERRYNEKKLRREKSFTFVYCLLTRLGFPRDMRRYIAQRVFY
jgi:hypothetical protein